MDGRQLISTVCVMTKDLLLLLSKLIMEDSVEVTLPTGRIVEIGRKILKHFYSLSIYTKTIIMLLKDHKRMFSSIAVMVLGLD